MTTTITPYQAVKRMKELTDIDVPFSISFMSYSSTTGLSSGKKTVTTALLRKGLRDDQSEFSQQLIGYVDMDKGGANRFFHLPLLLTFNEYTIKP